jgi:hypothetical protein
MVLACVVGAWVVLDLRWQAGLFERLAATRSLYAGLSWDQRKDIVGDDGTLRVANELKALLRDEPGSARILVHASSGYSVLRLIWHLLPLNTAALWIADPGTPLPEGCLVVFYDSDAWHRDPAMRRLLARSERIWPSDVVMRSGFERGDEVVVFRYRHAR